MWIHHGQEQAISWYYHNLNIKIRYWKYHDIALSSEATLALHATHLPNTIVMINVKMALLFEYHFILLEARLAWL